MGKGQILTKLRSESTNVFANADVMQPYLLDDPSKCFDWRNHVPEFIGDLWESLNETERRLVMITCEFTARKEEW